MGSIPCLSRIQTFDNMIVLIRIFQVLSTKAQCGTEGILLINAFEAKLIANYLRVAVVLFVY